MQDLNDLYFFAQVVEHRGFAAAARALGLPKSRLSRRVAELEKRIGVRLLHRTTRRFAVTEIGQDYYVHARAMTLEAQAAQEVVEKTLSGPQGRIRVSAPPALVCFQLGRMIAAFMVAYPRVSVELVATNRAVDLIEEGIDVALRVRSAPARDGDLIVRKLGESVHRLVAAPSLVPPARLPLAPADLAGFPSLAASAGAREDSGREHIWTLHSPDGAHARIPHRPRLVTDDMAQLLHAALNGVGVVDLPRVVAHDHLVAGGLLDVLSDWAPPRGAIQAVFPSRRGVLPSVRSFIDFLVQSFASEDFLQAAEAHGGRLTP